MPQQASPRGTFLKIADVVRAQIEADDDMAELPAAVHGVLDSKPHGGVNIEVRQVRWGNPADLSGFIARSH